MDSNDNEEINESINHRIRQANGDPNAIIDMNAQNDKSQAVLDSFTELKETTTTYTIFKSPVRSINISEPSTPSLLGNVIRDKEDSLREIRDGSVEKEEANEDDNTMNGKSDHGIDTDDEEEVQEHDYDDDELVAKRILIQRSKVSLRSLKLDNSKTTEVTLNNIPNLTGFPSTPRKTSAVSTPRHSRRPNQRATPKSTPRSTPRSTPKSTPKSTPRSPRIQLTPLRIASQTPAPSRQKTPQSKQRTPRSQRKRPRKSITPLTLRAIEDAAILTPRKNRLLLTPSRQRSTKGYSPRQDLRLLSQLLFKEKEDNRKKRKLELQETKNLSILFNHSNTNKDIENNDSENQKKKPKNNDIPTATARTSSPLRDTHVDTNNLDISVVYGSDDDDIDLTKHSNNHKIGNISKISSAITDDKTPRRSRLSSRLSLATLIPSDIIDNIAIPEGIIKGNGEFGSTSNFANDISDNEDDFSIKINQNMDPFIDNDAYYDSEEDEEEDDENRRDERDNQGNIDYGDDRYFDDDENDSDDDEEFQFEDILSKNIFNKANIEDLSLIQEDNQLTSNKPRKPMFNSSHKPLLPSLFSPNRKPSYDSLPINLIRNLSKTLLPPQFHRRLLSPENLKVISSISNEFIEQQLNDLQNYSSHSKRKIINSSDALLLMKRSKLDDITKDLLDDDLLNDNIVNDEISKNSEIFSMAKQFLDMENLIEIEKLLYNDKIQIGKRELNKLERLDKKNIKSSSVSHSQNTHDSDVEETNTTVQDESIVKTTIASPSDHTVNNTTNTVFETPTNTSVNLLRNNSMVNEMQQILKLESEKLGFSSIFDSDRYKVDNIVDDDDDDDDDDEDDEEEEVLEEDLNEEHYAEEEEQEEFEDPNQREVDLDTYNSNLYFQVHDRSSDEESLTIPMAIEEDEEEDGKD
ncbi:hypothetical protein BVG19_g3949 [[Candida] boidinii]|nr:hypothetical protein BVG19_g3949 [[Candida] boidinii]OWB51564.1 hypothetical protein B5S27_g3128 [[Candida] boidinii]